MTIYSHFNIHFTFTQHTKVKTKEISILEFLYRCFQLKQLITVYGNENILENCRTYFDLFLFSVKNLYTYLPI